MLDRSLLDEALDTLGVVLRQRGLAYDVTVVGGSGLLLLGLIIRPTQDLDIVALTEGGIYVSAEPLPTPLAEAARDVADVFGLPERWFNSGPTELLDLGLPVGFAERAEVRRYGALTIRLASRLDQIHLKLYAAVDQGPRSKHVGDVRALAPTPDELLQAARWARTHDPSSAFRGLLLDALRFFGVDDVDDRL